VGGKKKDRLQLQNSARKLSIAKLHIFEALNKRTIKSQFIYIIMTSTMTNYTTVQTTN